MGARLPADARARATAAYGARGPIGFFLHIPFPPPRSSRDSRGGGQILGGLLGADVVSFHTDSYRDNFVRACPALRDDVEAKGTGSGSSTAAPSELRPTRSRSTPPTSPVAPPAPAPTAPELAARAVRGTRRVLLGVDRLDYTKGILGALRALELLLELRRPLRSELAFLQVAVPSRGEIREYRQLRAKVEQPSGGSTGASPSQATTSPSTISIAASPQTGSSPTTGSPTCVSSRRSPTG